MTATQLLEKNGCTVYKQGEDWFVTREGKKTIQGPSEYVAASKAILIWGLACCKSLVRNTPINK